jgi:glyoxylase-like metal-dependent hydrolase (beta-lactamase superfamily II)
LAKHGFSRDDITDAFLTHLHFDHCGGSIVREGDKLVPAFRNAVYWSNPSHWKWAVEPNQREKASFLKENILPIKESGKLQFIEHPHEGKMGRGMAAIPEGKFTENISLLFVNGHTESMMLPKIRYKGKTIVFMADLLPSQGHIPLPYVMAYDMFPLTTLLEKEAFLKDALVNDYVLFFEHDPQHECCNLRQSERGIRPKDFFKISDI